MNPVSALPGLQSLYDLLPKLTPTDRELIERAYRRAEMGHADVYRHSGEPYFTHCVEVARILAEMKLDPEAIAAALMHDLLEDTDITFEQLRKEFGDTIAGIVDGVTKLKVLPIEQDLDAPAKPVRTSNKELEYIRKMLMAMNNDIRVMLVKLADRLHNMRTLGYMKPEKQVRIAQETLDIFAPLANRLGIWQIKWELEDLSFRYLNPDAYRKLVKNVDEKRAEREAYMKRVTAQLRKELGNYPSLSDVQISGRPKHIYSIFKKMERKRLPFDQIFDVRAVRLIVQTIPDCYLALGVVHSIWKPIPGEFDDYIATPKDNFYRSLHTAVYDDEGKTVEVQIRTWDMHEHAEYGVAAHWRYKEGGAKGRDEDFEKRISYLRRLMEFGAETEDPKQFVDAMKSDVFESRVVAFTPKGDVVDLPQGSTAIDFAYHIHTDIGHRCRGAKVNGRLISLDYKLQSGDQVEINTVNRGGPSLDWLNENLGYVKTERARSKIRYWFRKQNREKHIGSGRDVLYNEMKRLGVLDILSFETVAGWFNHERLEDFLAAVGAGDINGSQIFNRIVEVERREHDAQQKELLVARAPSAALSIDKSNGVSVLGMGGLLVNLARCCNPMPGDEIIGYVTRGRGVTVHRTGCPNLGTELERTIPVEWGRVNQEQRFEVPVEVVAHDRNGLVKDISTIIADEKLNITDVKVDVRGNIAIIYIRLEIANATQLQRVLTRIGSIHSVTDAYRRSVRIAPLVPPGDAYSLHH